CPASGTEDRYRSAEQARALGGGIDRRGVGRRRGDWKHSHRADDCKHTYCFGAEKECLHVTHHSGVHWRPSCLTDHETSSFASPAHAEFALFSWVYSAGLGRRRDIHYWTNRDWTSVRMEAEGTAPTHPRQPPRCSWAWAVDLSGSLAFVRFESSGRISNLSIRREAM